MQIAKGAGRGPYQVRDAATVVCLRRAPTAAAAARGKYHMSVKLKGSEGQVSKLVDSNTRPRPTTARGSWNFLCLRSSLFLFK
jgi:hypothetical protein